jgi:hypothetical protein
MMAISGVTVLITGRDRADKAALIRALYEELKSRGRKVEVLGDEAVSALLPRSEEPPANGKDSGGADSAVIAERHSGADVIVLVALDEPGASSSDLRRAPGTLVEVEVVSMSRSEAEIEPSSPDASGAVPRSAEGVLQVDAASLGQSVARILSRVEELAALAAPASQPEAYDSEDEEIIRRRLESLGYL